MESDEHEVAGEGGVSSLGSSAQKVIQILLRQGVLTQSDLSGETGLSRSTVSNVLGSLGSSGLVVPARRRATKDPAPRLPGRPSLAFQLQPDAGAAIGIDFHHTKFRVVVVNLAHRILAEASGDLSIDHSAQEAMKVSIREATRALERARIPKSRVLGAGIGIPGPIDSRSGYVTPSSVSPGWLGIDVRSEFEKLLRIPCVIDNDANLGALAEQRWGVGKGVDSFIYVRMDTGVGAGLVIDGKLVHGSSGAAGEIGHITLDEHGPVCRCGNRGCLECFVGTNALLDLLKPVHGPKLTVSKMISLAKEGDLRCRRVLADAGHLLGVGLADVATMVNPDLFVIGGSLAGAGDILFDSIRQALRRNTVELVHRSLRVVPSKLGERAEVMGAVALALDQPAALQRILEFGQNPLDTCMREVDLDHGVAS